MYSSFFEMEDYYIPQKNIFLNTYTIFNDKREGVGLIKLKQNLFRKILKSIFGSTILPFTLEIRNENGRLQASVCRKGMYLISKTIIKDGNGNQVGRIQQNFPFFKQKFKIINTENKIIAEIAGDCKHWNIVINDAVKKEIGRINKDFKKRIFKRNDKYKVHFEATISGDDDKIAIISSALAFNLVL